MADQVTAPAPTAGGREGVRLVERTERSWVQKHLPQLLTAPAFLVPTLLTVVAWVGNFYALTDFDLRFGIRNYVGLGNFITLFTTDPYFKSSLATTLKFAAICMAIELPVGFLMSMALDHATAQLARFARALVVIPMCIAPTIATMMWKIMMGPTQGIFNYMLKIVGLKPVDWFGNPDVVLFSLALIDAWIFVPFVILVFWGGWQSLPKPPYEAAALDGASGWFVFRKLTVPLMSPFIMIVLLFRMCDTLNAFETIWVSTKGGPNVASRTMSILAYDQALRYNHMGYGVAVVTVLGLLVYFVIRRLFVAWRHEQLGAD